MESKNNTIEEVQVSNKYTWEVNEKVTFSLVHWYRYAQRSGYVSGGKTDVSNGASI